MSMIADFQRLMMAAEEIADSFPAVPGQAGVVGVAVGAQDLQLVFQGTHAALIAELVSRIHAQRPQFFECLVIDVLLAMGYGKGRQDMAKRLGQTGDGGVDGLISLDELGLDLLYIQAKRLRPGNPVPIADVRDFAGSLEAKHATKGVFVTTTHFSPGAQEFCARITRRVALIDGTQLAELMIRHNIGVKVRETYCLKQVDPQYFSGAPPVRGEEALSPVVGYR